MLCFKADHLNQALNKLSYYQTSKNDDDLEDKVTDDIEDRVLFEEEFVPQQENKNPNLSFNFNLKISESSLAVNLFCNYIVNIKPTLTKPIADGSRGKSNVIRDTVQARPPEKMVEDGHSNTRRQVKELGLTLHDYDGDIGTKGWKPDLEKVLINSLVYKDAIPEYQKQLYNKKV